MKTRKTILVISLFVLMILCLSFNSFATENTEGIVDLPDESTGNDNSNVIEDSTTGNDVENEPSNDDIVNDSNNTENDGTNTENNNEEVPNQNENEYKPPVNEKPTNKKPTNKKPTSENPTDENPTDEKINMEQPTHTQQPTESDSNNSSTEILSDNTNLAKLILDVEGLSPEFDKDITEYYLIVDLSVESVNIEAYPEHQNSIVMIEGNNDLQEGENTISITVRAESGKTKTYTIYVSKTDDVDMVNANLKNLSVKGFSFYPSFKNNIYNYNLTINEKLSSIEIMAETEIEDATYEIIGNKNLVEGDNLIKIIVTAKDGISKREYKMNVFVSFKNVEIQKTNRIPAIILLSVIGVAIIGIAIAISKKH